MISLSKRVSILIEIFKELKQRGDPDICVEKYYKFPVDASKAREIISEFHNNPSVIDNCSQNERDSFYLVLVGYPLYVAFDYLNQQYKTLFPNPLDSRELFESVKSYIPKRGVTFDYFGKINPAISYLLVESVEKDDFNSFNKLILEYYDQLKDPLLRIFHFHSHDNENDSSNDIPWEVREALLSEQYKLGYPFEPEMEEIVRDAIDYNTARIMVGKVEIAYLDSYLNLLDDTFIQSIKELHRFIAKQYLSGHFYYSPYIENEALGKLINSPLFPEIYKEVRTEIEGRNENEKQEKPQSTTQIGSQKPEGDGEKKSRFEWPSWEEFKEKTSIGIPRDFEFLTKLVDGIKNDINPEEDSEVDSKGYERFKRFMNTLADYGSIGDDANMKSLIQFITGKCFAGASSKIRWNADNHLGRVLYFVVQWISEDDEKLGKTARMTDFIYEKSPMPDNGLDMDKISSTLQRAKGIRPDILGRLHDCYAFIPGTKGDAGKRKS